MGSASALWPYYVGIILISTVAAALNLVSPFIVREAVDTVVDKGDLSMIVWLAIALFAAYSANTFMRNIGGYLGDVVAARIRQVLSTRYFAKLLSLPQKYFDGQVTGTIIARLDRSIMNITQTVQSFSNTLLPMLLQVIAILGITAFFYWPLTLLLLALFPIYLVLTAMTSKRWQKFEGEKNKEIDLANGRFAEVVGQVKVTKSFVAETRELEKFGKHYGRTIDLTRPQSRWWHSMDIARGMAMNLVFLGIYLILFIETYNGRFSIGDMVMLIQLVTMAQQPVQMMSWLVDSAQRAIAGSRDYFKVMDEEIEESANTQVLSLIHI